MYTLFIDTHFKDINIILYKDNKVVSKKTISDSKSTSKETMPSIIETLAAAKINIKDLNKIAIVRGPGSFTGIRLGVTIAKVLSYALNIPIVSLTSLDLISINVYKDSYVAVLENNGAFVSKAFSSDIIYLKKDNYEEFKKQNEVFEDTKLDELNLIKFINTLSIENPFNVNPLYVKNIEALNDK